MSDIKLNLSKHCLISQISLTQWKKQCNASKWKWEEAFLESQGPTDIRTQRSMNSISNPLYLGQSSNVFVSKLHLHYEIDFLWEFLHLQIRWPAKCVDPFSPGWEGKEEMTLYLRGEAQLQCHLQWISAEMTPASSGPFLPLYLLYMSLFLQSGLQADMRFQMSTAAPRCVSLLMPSCVFS